MRENWNGNAHAVETAGPLFGTQIQRTNVISRRILIIIRNCSWTGETTKDEIRGNSDMSNTGRNRHVRAGDETGRQMPSSECESASCSWLRKKIEISGLLEQFR
jgi:hypothetical protein